MCRIFSYYSLFKLCFFTSDKSNVQTIYNVVNCSAFRVNEYIVSYIRGTPSPVPFSVPNLKIVSF